MHIEVIPIGHMVGQGGLDYFVPATMADAVRVGSIVEIPLRDAVVSGIVGRVGIVPATEDVRSIVGVSCPTPVLDAGTMAAIYAIAHRSYIHVHRVLGLFLPMPVITSLAKYAYAGAVDVSDDREARPAPWSHEYTFALHDEALFARIDSYRELGSRMVIIFPDDPLAGRYHGTIDTPAALYPRRLTPARQYRRYCEMARGDSSVVVGTRSLLMAPLWRYDRIVYVEDTLATHLMTHFHRIAYRTILDAVVEHGGHTLSIVSTVPDTIGLFRAFRDGWAVDMPSTPAG